MAPWSKKKRVYCHQCGNSITVDHYPKGGVTDEGRGELKRAGWRMVALVGWQCKRCRKELGERVVLDVSAPGV